MRSLWKVFVVGGLTGAAVGAALSLVGPRRPTRVSNQPTGPTSRLSLNTAWTGFVVGAVTGSGVGLAVDLGMRSGHGLAAAATNAGHAIAQHTPELTHQLSESETVQAIGTATKQTAHQAIEAARDASATSKNAAVDAVRAIGQALPDRP